MKTETKHTPGLWKANDGIGTSEVVRYNLGVPITIVDVVEGQPEERFANARLIAAAPDLLASLRDFSLAVWSDCRLPGEMRKELEALYHNAVQAAIAKAEPCDS